MPLIIAKPLIYIEEGYKSYYIMDAEKLSIRYPKVFAHENVYNKEVYIQAYINRIFNERLEIINQPKMTAMIQVRSFEVGKKAKKYLDLTRLALELSIAQGYIVEVLAINFEVCKQKNYNSPVKKTELVIFPNEVIIDADEAIKNRIEEEYTNLKKVGERFETVILLRNVGLGNIANELMDGLMKSDKNDYEGAIKAYRNVVEGFRNLVKNNVIDGSKTRTQKFLRFLKAAYNLLSNFGMHMGTRAYLEEGVFARDLVIALSRYMINKSRYLKKK